MTLLLTIGSATDYLLITEYSRDKQDFNHFNATKPVDLEKRIPIFDTFMAAFVLLCNISELICFVIIFFNMFRSEEHEEKCTYLSYNEKFKLRQFSVTFWSNYTTQKEHYRHRIVDMAIKPAYRVHTENDRCSALMIQVFYPVQAPQDSRHPLPGEQAGGGEEEEEAERHHGGRAFRVVVRRDITHWLPRDNCHDRDCHITISAILLGNLSLSHSTRKLIPEFLLLY